MTFQDLQNLVLMRTRQKGVNFGGAAANAATDFEPPYEVKLLLNTAYNEFLCDTLEAGIATLKVSFPTANANTVAGQTVNIRPIPPNGGTINPAALRVYEFTYTQNGAQERYIPIVGTVRFRRWAGGYTRRLGNYAAFPQVIGQQFGKPYLDMVPGLGVNGDAINLTVCPDPMNSPGNCPATNGGILVNDADVPLFPGQFHMALVEFALMKLCDAASKTTQRDKSKEAYDEYVEKAKTFGSTYGEGDSDQAVVDVWDTYNDRDISIWC